MASLDFAFSQLDDDECEENDDRWCCVTAQRNCVRQSAYFAYFSVRSFDFEPSISQRIRIKMQKLLLLGFIFFFLSYFLFPFVVDSHKI